MVGTYAGGNGWAGRFWSIAAGLALVLIAAPLAWSEEASSTAEIKIDVQLVADGNSAAATSTTPATHQQVKVLRPAESGAWKLASFCLTKDGRIVTVLERQGAAQRSGGLFGAVIDAFSTGSGDSTAKAPAKGEAKTAPAVAQVRILDADGKLQEQFDLDFKAQAVNVCPAGSLVLGGDGVLACYDLSGKELARTESPHIVASRTDKEAIKRQAREMLDQQRNAYKEAIKNLEVQKEELAKKDEKSLTEEERQLKQQMDQIMASYKQAVAQQGDKPITDEQVEATVQSLVAQGRRINAVAVSDKHIYCTAPASKGHGYSVWRTEPDFSNPQRIVDGLSGCCGQMDIQCCGDDVVVAENSRKRVVRFNSEGKQISSWGQGSRDGEGDTFGSCCNPMNTRAVGDKLYVSDSDGRVRLFTLEGKYQGEVGKANVREGCKSSIVDISPDGNRLYYIDVNNSAICVLDHKPDADKQAAR